MGCLSSHLRIAPDATINRLENYLVLEADMLFTRMPRFISIG